MSIFLTQNALKDLRSISQNDALDVIYRIFAYEKKQEGYVKWLEARPGYRLRAAGHRVLFELKSDHMIILKISPPLTDRKGKTNMDIDYELLGNDKAVISLKDFELMQDMIAYDHAKAEQTEEDLSPIDIALHISEGESPLKVYRKHRNLSQKELSTHSNVPQGLISEIETGKKQGSLNSLIALSNTLKVTVDDLLIKKRATK